MLLTTVFRNGITAWRSLTVLHQFDLSQFLFQTWAKTPYNGEEDSHLPQGSDFGALSVDCTEDFGFSEMHKNSMPNELSPESAASVQMIISVP